MAEDKTYKIYVSYPNARQGMMGWKTREMSWEEVTNFRDTFTYCCNNQRSYVVLEDEMGSKHYLSWKLVLDMEFKTY